LFVIILEVQTRLGEFLDMNGIRVELRVNEQLAPSVMRAFAGCTVRDAEVDALPVPRRPIWLNMCVGCLRWYRKTSRSLIGHRCVFDPSCSRYSELALRKYGLAKGVIFTVRRLSRCRSNAGGVDEP
jgi:putative component of membrane protein insertase Oxa1/YidC/SpoIIIJ protein YidD